MALTEPISARIPQPLYHQLSQFTASNFPERGGVSRVLVAALESFLANATVKPRATVEGAWTNPHSPNCRAVYEALRVGPLTTSELSRRVGKSVNNCARRVKDLADAGYVQKTGKQRKSLDSGYMLDVWEVTEKEYKE